MKILYIFQTPEDTSVLRTMNFLCVFLNRGIPLYINILLSLVMVYCECSVPLKKQQQQQQQQQQQRKKTFAFGASRECIVTLSYGEGKFFG